MKDSDKKTSAILTFQSAYNFGAVLQAYALQQYLIANYGQTKILDYHNSDIDKVYEMPTVSELMVKPKQAISRFLRYVLYRGKNARIDQFRRDFFNLTERYDKNNIFDANDEADVFITGSDQVWNHMIIGKDTSYFLDFVDMGKATCSYAASIGVKVIPDEYIELYKKAITHIHKISVRETAAIQTLNEIGIHDAEVMPDPTLLISETQWKTLSISPNEKNKYILVYKITRADRLIPFAKKLSKITGLPIIYIPNDLKSGVVGSLKLDVGPREWLGYISNAEYVVTNSFHGTVFSILFGVKFFSEVAARVNPSTSRLMTLLSLFGLENRTIDCFTNDMLRRELPKDHITRICCEQQARAKSFFEEVFQKGK